MFNCADIRKRRLEGIFEFGEREHDAVVAAAMDEPWILCGRDISKKRGEGKDGKDAAAKTHDAEQTFRGSRNGDDFSGARETGEFMDAQSEAIACDGDGKHRLRFERRAGWRE